MSTASKVITIEQLTVRADRLVCEVALAPGAARHTTPALTKRIREAFPDIVRHACVNDEGDTFGAVIDHTSLPHVLEHLVISIQTSAAAKNRAASNDLVFTGTTEWIDEKAGRARIEVSFTDDLVALRAFRDATRFLNETVVP